MKDISYLFAQYDNKTTLGKESLLGSIIFLTDRDHYYWQPTSDNPKNSSCLSQDKRLQGYKSFFVSFNLNFNRFIMPEYTLKVNGKSVTVDVDADTPLLWVLRDELNMVGTKFGCGIAQCGACTVHLDHNAIRSCSLPISIAQDRDITTIEGLSEDGSHPVQEAWKEIGVPQCGYRQSGQIMTAAAFLKQNPNPSRKEIREAMHSNICRCASYNRIEKAVALAAKNL